MHKFLTSRRTENFALTRPEKHDPSTSVRRRDFLRHAALGAMGLAFRPAALIAKDPPEGFRGVFPIMQTPYTDAGEVDFETLAKEVQFISRAGAPGMVWPQLASEYAELSFEERLEGAETIVNTAKGSSSKVVIGVQAGDLETALKYARYAEKIQPDAIIALPARKGDQREFDLDQVANYYKAISQACRLPLFIQTIGNMSVEFVLQLARDIPDFHFVKDEAGETLARITEFGKHPGAPAVFSGAHGVTLLDEMARGSAGTMPAASLVDLYVQVWDLWQSGKRHDAIDRFSKVLLFVNQAFVYGLPSLNYVLHLRGVFPNWRVRDKNARPLQEPDKAALRRTLDFVKPL